eukprot:12296188-Heterocapsa_arctica.AAC.1
MPESLIVYLADIPVADRTNHLWCVYLMARRRWRNFNIRGTRLERRSLRRIGKGKSKDKGEKSGNPR